MNYKIGGIVWYIPGYADNYLILIKCKITEIDDYFQKKDKNSIILYWIDEPTGHSLDKDDFFEDQGKAIEELKRRVGECYKYNDKIDYIATLDSYRKQKIKSINNENIKDYPDKIQKIDWFNLNDLNKDSPGYIEMHSIDESEPLNQISLYPPKEDKL